jgi:hypothetical protein
MQERELRWCVWYQVVHSHRPVPPLHFTKSGKPVIISGFFREAGSRLQFCSMHAYAVTVC